LLQPCAHAGWMGAARNAGPHELRPSWRRSSHRGRRRTGRTTRYLLTTAEAAPAMAGRRGTGKGRGRMSGRTGGGAGADAARSQDTCLRRWPWAEGRRRRRTALRARSSYTSSRRSSHRSLRRTERTTKLPADDAGHGLEVGSGGGAGGEPGAAAPARAGAE